VVSNGASTQANQLGLEPNAYGGLTGDPAEESSRPHSDFGDQIWVWENNTFKDYYWLMTGANAGRWWNYRTGTYATFTLEPGRAYFFKHNASNGTDFDWTPTR